MENNKEIKINNNEIKMAKINTDYKGRT